MTDTHFIMAMICFVFFCSILIALGAKEQLDTWGKELYKKICDLTYEEPARWALLLEKYFSSRKDEEGLMLAQAISKKLVKRRKRRMKVVQDSPQPEQLRS